MHKLLRLSLIGLCASAALASLPAAAQGKPEITLTRMADCGTSPPPIEVNQRFSDTWAYPGVKIAFTYSCYLIKHGNDYLLWDTGQSMSAPNVAPKTSLPDQLAKLNLKPSDIKFVGISHYHGDHTGQVASFPDSTLLIGKGDWDGIIAATPPAGVNVSLFTHWTKEGGKVEPVVADKDVFGDGSVIMLNTPGHTPGHHSLLVKLAKMGPVILTGDLVHFHENYDHDGVPSFNYDRAESLASIDRVKKIMTQLKAKMVIQHDVRDIKKLPAFPAGAN
jgi:glyoxylase-like metal-dependent hydrolase (beta-lactamase superfamily II)